MDQRDKILELVRSKGPLLPGEINREIRTNVLFASAMLSELVDSNKLKLTNLKVGSSPLYYAVGQEHMLQKFTQHIGQKQKRAFELLKNNKILRDTEQEPLTRACLREIKDFAVPLEVTLNNNMELFWKFYLLSDDEATQLISSYLNIDSKPNPKVEEINAQQSQDELISEPNNYRENETLAQTADIQAQAIPTSQTPTHQQVLPEQYTQPVYSTTISTQIFEEELFQNHTQAQRESKPLPEHQKEITDKPKPRLKEKEIITESQQKILEFPKDDVFFKEINSFFKKKAILIQDITVIRKGSEIDFIIELPSNVGNLNYFCKAKAKKKIGDGDLSSAFIQGNIKKLPVLFITKGDLTKKAKELLSTEFKSMFVKQI